MFKKRTFVFLILSALLMQAFFVQTSLNGAVYSSVRGATAEAVMQPISEIFTPNAVPGTEIIQTNHLPEGDMETTEANGEPSSFYGSGSSYALANFSYQDEVHSGTYGAYMSCKGTEQHSGFFSRSRSFISISERSYLDQDIELELWYNAKTSPDYGTGASSYFYIWFSTDVGNRYIYYYLSRVSGLPLNGSTTAFIDVRGSFDSWNFISRNLTEDFLSVFGGADLSASYCFYMYLVTSTPANPTGENIILFDDMEVTNSTGFNFFSDNGDFEDGDASPWSNYAEGPGTLYTTPDKYTEGIQSMNLTADCLAGDNAYSYMWAVNNIYDSLGAVPKSYIALKPGDLWFNYDWQYSDDVSAGGSQNCYFYFYAQNETFSANIYFFLGSESDMIPNSNNSGVNYINCYMAADGLGIRDAWTNFSIDIFSVLTDLDLTNLIPTTVGFAIEGTQTTGCSINLFVDDFQIITYPAVDPGFEGNIGYIPSMPIQQWSGPNDPYHINVTTDAYAGNYAANVSAYIGNTNVACYQDTFLPTRDNLYFDCYWRLDQLTASGTTYASISLEIDNTKAVHYILGYNQNMGIQVNNSDNVYYYVENCNQTGTWYNLFRDVTEDIFDAFGDTYALSSNITRINLRSYGITGGITSTLFDEINFIRDNAIPTISNIQQTPSSVDYTDTVTITADIDDNFGVLEAKLFYSISAAPYTELSMTYTGGTEYSATIPTVAYGNTVYYYVQAYDINDNSNIGPVNYPLDYFIYDTVPPTVEVEAPPTHSIVTGEIIFNITAYDLGSGIDHFEIEINMERVYNESTAPTTYTWVTTDYTDGDYFISFYVEDIQGSSSGKGFYYTIDNVPNPTNVSALFSGLVSLGLVLVASSTIIYLSERRKKYLKRR